MWVVHYVRAGSAGVVEVIQKRINQLETGLKAQCNHV